MAISDCEKCWETPCVCGFGYRTYTKEARLNLASNILGIPANKLSEMLGDSLPEAHPMKEPDQVP